MKTKVHLGARTYAFPSQILHLEAYQNYTHIRFSDGSRLLSSTHLGALEKRLSDFNFFRVNRAILVNLDYLSGFDSDSKVCQVSTGQLDKISVSRRRKLALLETLKTKLPLKS